MWKYKRVTDADTKQVCNHPCKVKKVALYLDGVATTAIIYNEKAGGTTKKVWTLATLGNAGAPYRISDEIDFGEQGADFYEGCFIAWVAGEILVLYKD